jgi:hypothetical protein
LGVDTLAYAATGLCFLLVFQNDPKCPEQALLLEGVRDRLFVVNVMK